MFTPMPTMMLSAACFAALFSASLLHGPQNAPATAPKAAPPATVPASIDSGDRASRLGESVALFDGTSLSGWRGFLPEGDPAQVWSVRDGVLVCTGSPVGYLVTDREFENFELTLEWRFDPAKGEGNSGVLLRIQQPDQVWPKSIEAQLHSKNAGDIWNIGEFPLTPDPSRTDGRRTRKAHDTNEKPLGEWNRYRIVLDGGHLQLFVNDLLQNEATGAKVISGRIALQSEGAHIEFRNIALRPIRSTSN